MYAHRISLGQNSGYVGVWMSGKLGLAQGVANRDLKLENLLLDRDGSDGTRPLLKICDFGVSKHVDDSTANTTVGTPVCMVSDRI